MSAVNPVAAVFVHVATQQKAGKRCYVTLKSETGRFKDELGHSEKKSEAVSLKALSEDFTSSTYLSIGNDIRSKYASYKNVGRAAATAFHTELSTALEEMKTYLNSHREKIAFKIMVFLNRWLPWFFKKSPEVALTEKLGYLQTMQDYLKKQYESIPTEFDLKIERKQNEIISTLRS